jgi:hypothetical protein
MSKPAYRYEQSYQFLKKGIKHTIREQVVDGEKGLSIMFLKKKRYAKSNVVWPHHQ